ncbi:MAG: RidA family protein [Verrucomicrobiales bacterium]|nr:RidA family protein [Verrucomicrobiales bacterium]
MNAESAAAALNLPPPPPKGGVYQTVVIVGKTAYVSGHGPYLGEAGYMSGKVGAELTLEEGQKAARQTGLSILSSLQAELGSLDRVKRVIKLLGMVNCPHDFTQHPQVINGCSELFAEVWGPENGVGARSAVGMGSLPGNIPVEIEGIFELAD